MHTFDPGPEFPWPDGNQLRNYGHVAQAPGQLVWAQQVLTACQGFAVPCVGPRPSPKPKPTVHKL